MGAGIVATIAVVLFVVGFVGGIFAAPAIFPPASEEVLVVGTNTPFTPFEFRDENGTLVGFTIDLVEEIASRAGRTVEWRDFNVWESLLLAGQTGAVDMIASSMTITAERDVVYDFSNSYYSANQAVLVPTSSTLTCADNTCTATDMMGLTWVVQTGTTSNDWVTDTLGENCQTGGPLFCFGDVATVLSTVRTGGADVAIMDLPAAVTFAADPTNALKAIGKIVTGELYGMAVEEGDPLDILPLINPIINQLQSDGFIEALAVEWEIPTEVT